MADQNNAASPDSTTSNEVQGKVLFCSHCGNETFTHLIANYNKFENDDLVWRDDTWNLYLCPVCNNVTLEHIFADSEDLNYEYDHAQGEHVIVARTAILHPSNPVNSLPEPHKDLPNELIKDYEEARSIAHLSPRSAAALLRLLVEKLCVHLGAEGKDINAYIAFLVRNGLPENVQKAFDIVRLIGNNAVHPGTIDLKDNIEIVSKLFTLINVAVEYQITQPKLIAELYSGLPQQKLDAIAKRDGK